MMQRITKKYVHEICETAIGCCIEVHKNLGPGLLESVYHSCTVRELMEAGLDVKSEVYVPIFYKDIFLEGSLKLDVLLNDLVVLEFKSVETMIPLYKAQLLSYLKLLSKPKGLLINFNVENISRSLISLVTEHYARLENG